MNATITGQDNSFDYKVEFRHANNVPRRKSLTSSSRSFGKRRGKGPQLFNGIHRRRRKNISW